MIAAAYVVAAIGLLYWGLQLYIIVRVARSVPILKDLPEETLDGWPRVSVIMTACNEEAALEQAVRARLEEDYPNLELILVQDRSTDRTPEIARRLGESDPRLKVIHITQLPEGWLGKLNAMQKGLDAATGEWLLFSDGDVAVHKGALRRVVGYCEENALDHCAVLPALRPVNPILDCMTSIFMRLVTLNFRIWSIENPRSGASVGIGAFNFVRRGIMEKMGGFMPLRMEVADDITLGQMLKAAGACQSVLNGKGLVELQFHRSVGDSLRSAERATYTAIGNFSLARLAAIGLAAFLLELSPLWAMALSGTPLSFALSVILIHVAMLAMVACNRWLGRSSLNLMLLPVAEWIILYSQLRSGVLGALRGGILWRGTFYPNALLKAGRRFKP
jgi:glycosyltransferase involved in cell wall biosynthesis